MTSSFKFQHESGDVDVEVSWTNDSQGFYLGSVIFPKGQEPIKIEIKLDSAEAPSIVSKFVNELVSNGYVAVENV